MLQYCHLLPGIVSTERPIRGNHPGITRLPFGPSLPVPQKICPGFRNARRALIFFQIFVYLVCTHFSSLLESSGSGQNICAGTYFPEHLCELYTRNKCSVKRFPKKRTIYNFHKTRKFCFRHNNHTFMDQLIQSMPRQRSFRIILFHIFINLFRPFPDILAIILKEMHSGSQSLRNSRFNLLLVDFRHYDCRYPIIEYEVPIHA